MIHIDISVHQSNYLSSFRATLPDVHVFNVAIGQPEIIDGINGVLMPCIDQVLLMIIKIKQQSSKAGWSRPKKSMLENEYEIFHDIEIVL